MQLHQSQEQRIYLTESERTAFLDAAAKAPREVRTFFMVLTFTGCRILEALALTEKGIDFGAKAIKYSGK